MFYCTDVIVLNDIKGNRGSLSFTDKKIQNSAEPLWKIFQYLFVAHECLNITKNFIHLRDSEYSPLQKLQQSSKMLTLAVFRTNWKVEVQIICKRSKRKFFLNCCIQNCQNKNAWFLVVIFPDVPGPKWISRTFEVSVFSRKKSKTFQQAWKPLKAPRKMTKLKTDRFKALCVNTAHHFYFMLYNIVRYTNWVSE